MSKKKKSRTEELITEPFIIKDEKTVERLLDALESPKRYKYTLLINIYR